MSLAWRLRLWIVGLVAAAVLALSLVNLNSLAGASLRHTSERAQAAAQIVKITLLQKTSQAPLDVTGEDEVIQAWRDMIGDDPEVRKLLSATLSQSRSLVEISVAGARGRIITSSNPARVGGFLVPRLTLAALDDLNPADRLAAIFAGSIDYESRVELGIPKRKEPVFTVQVLISSVLLREAFRPDLERTAVVSMAALAAAILLAVLASQWALRPLAGISQTIDRIALGQTETPAAPAPVAAPEFAVVQEKLRMLGEQFRGAQAGASQLRGSVQQLLERLEEAVLLFDHQGRLLVSGEPAERMLGVSRDQITGRLITEIFPPGTSVGAAIYDALETRRALRQKLAGRMLVTLDFLAHGSVVVRLRDAEGPRLLEDRLQVSSRLAAILRLTGGVAHEIKNPLNSIRLRLELLRQRVQGEVPESKEELDILTVEITRLDRVVRTFLDFTRPVEVRTEPLDIREVLAEMAVLVKPEADHNAIAVRESVPPAPLVVRADSGLLKQALLNIIRNAIEVMPNGGQLDLSAYEQDGQAVLEVSDTGPGIPPEAREKVFQLYYSTKEKGTGIGLAMAFRAAQLHGGSIEVADNHHQPSSAGAPAATGATFRIRLPLAGIEGVTA